MPFIAKPSVTESSDSELAKKISLAWLNYAQEQSTTQQEKLEQLRVSISRDLTLESAARQSCQPVCVATYAEPSRVSAVSRLDVANLTKRLEEAQPGIKLNVGKPDTADKTLHGCPAGATALEISKAGNSGAVPVCATSHDQHSQLLASAQNAPDASSLTPALANVTAGEQANASPILFVRLAQSAHQVASPELLGSLIRANGSPMQADTKIHARGDAYERPAKVLSRQHTRKGTRPDATSQCTRQPSGVAASPDEPGCMLGTGYVFSHGQLESGAIPSGKRGNLLFTSSFEGGNIGNIVVKKPKHDYVLHVRPDTRNDRFRLWFHFKVRNAKNGQHVHLAIVNFSKTRSLFRIGMTPVYRSSTMFPQWQRLPSECCFYYTQDSPTSDYALSMAVQFHGGPEEVYEFAFSFPYTYTYLQHTLHWVENMACMRDSRSHSWINRRLLCRTPQMRRVDMLVISEPMVELPQAWTTDEFVATVQRNEGEGQPAYVGLLQKCSFTSSGQRMIQMAQEGVRNAVFITGRVHPGESPASHVIHGLVAFLTSQDPTAIMLRKMVTWIVVPMLNPDGVAAGNYRCDAGGLDLNRLWRSPSRDMEPSLFYSLKTMMEIDADSSFSLDAYIDVHSHSNSRAGFLYMNPLPASHSGCPPLLELLYRLPKAMGSLVPGFLFSKCCCSTETSKAACGRRAAGMHLPNTLCYTFEISFFNAMEDSSAASLKSAKAASHNGSGDPAALDYANSVAGYHDMGRSLACSFLPFYTKCSSSTKPFGSTQDSSHQ
eukprot:jgi/Ulvmu1/7584/UM038_0007.1